MVEVNKKVEQQGYMNLKSIHALQANGAIQSMLRSVNGLRGQAEQLAKSVNEKRKSYITSNSAQESAIKEAPIETKIAEPVKIENSTETQEKTNRNFVQRGENFAPRYEQNNNANGARYNNTRNFDRQNNGENRTFAPRGDRQPYQGNNFNRPNNGYNGQNRPFNGQNRNYQANGQRPQFGQNGQRFSSYNSQQNGQRPPYAQNGQNTINRGSFAGSAPRPFANRNTSFASSKTNNFRNFEQKESIDVLAQPVRQVGNKNKNALKNIDEKKQQAKRGFGANSNFRNNFIIEDDEGFSETTMGSRRLVKKKKEVETFIAPQVDSVIMTAEKISVKELSEKSGKAVVEIIKKLMMLGIMATINSEVDFDTAELVLSEFGVKVEQKLEKSYEEKMSDVVVAEKEDSKDLTKRPPVVTVMGHVDHGKTSLLDAFRNTAVVNGEAGGITQHIGAYQVVKNGEKITFIDTPGHAAFTAMRARGAECTDIAILVVAADDGIMPQTIEAINHIKAAKVPMIVAINKIDKPTANIERIKQQLTEHGVLPEEWGGDAVVVPVSARTGEGLDKLLSMILLVAEVADLKANPNRLGSGVVLEALLDKNKGPMATVLVQNGTLKLGDNIISGITFGKIRAMYDENGNQVKVAPPSTPVSILGLDTVPNVGDIVAAIDEKLTKKVIEERKAKMKQQATLTNSGVSLDDFMSKVNEGKLKSLNIIIKADVQGSVEALKATLCEIGNDEAKVVCIHSGAGAVTEGDVLLASASQAVIVAFNVKPQPKAKALAEQQKVEIKEYSIIYQAVDDLTASINGMVTPKYAEKVVGHATVRMVFKLSSGTVAGSYVNDGKIQRGAFAKVLRNGEVIGDAIIDALKIQKDDKAEVGTGFECGIKLKDFADYKEDDTIEVYVKERIN